MEARPVASRPASEATVLEATVVESESMPPYLPPGWEQRADPSGTLYYVNHATRATQSRNPRARHARFLKHLPRFDERERERRHGLSSRVRSIRRERERDHGLSARKARLVSSNLQVGPALLAQSTTTRAPREPRRSRANDGGLWGREPRAQRDASVAKRVRRAQVPQQRS